jgi:biotin transport system substrate-specific component
MYATRRMTAAALLTALTAASAYISIPVGPVPVTLQSGVVLTAGALLGSRWGAGSQIVYVFMGLIGLPVFAGGRSGPGVVLSPTFGYLIGFIAAAWLTGWLTERHPAPSRGRIMLAMAGGQGALTLSGVLYLYFYFNVILLQSTGWAAVFAVGVAPFLIGDSLKLVLAASTVMACRRIGIGWTGGIRRPEEAVQKVVRWSKNA